MSPAATAELVIARCRALGFAVAGVTDAKPSRYQQELMTWLAAGKHGEMTYLARNHDLRVDPARLVPGARSIICVADRYPGRHEVKAHTIGRIARYARGDDYHVVMKKRLVVLCDELATLFPSHQFRACVDTAPVLEREHAQRAGIGAVGKNTLLIQRGVGSYLLLGEIITTLELATSTSAEPDPCSGCTRCIDACPTQAITPWSVDAGRCISYLTIEHRTAIDPQFHEPIGDWLFGCDVCQEVCPHNQPTRRSKSASTHQSYTPRRDGFDLLDVLNWTEESRREAFAKSSMKRATLDMMKRNALIVAGNLPAEELSLALRDRITQLAADPTQPAMIRDTAAQVLARLRQRGLYS